MTIQVETEGRGKIKMQNAFPRFSKTSSGFRRSAPTTPGQHNAEVFSELLGWDEQTLSAYRQSGLI